MTQAELNAILDADSYHQERKNPTETEISLFLREVTIIVLFVVKN